MPRSARLHAPFQYYHLINRGINRQPIFHQPQDYLRFLEKLAASKSKFDWLIYSYCLMPNHYHLHIQVRHHPLGNILSSLQTSHSGYMNKKYHRTGSLFQNRFKSILIQKEPYHLGLSKYIHLNPVKAKLVPLPQDYPYSSYSEIIHTPKHPYHIIDRRAIKSLTGSLTPTALKLYREYIEESPQLDYDPQLAQRDILGSTHFRSQFE